MNMTIDPVKSIPAFYAGQSIFLTGATGFLGKVFIEKILRSCPDVREIFLLIRLKKGQNINERLKNMLNLPLYEKLRNERPLSFEKLVPISGNVSEKGLGLSATDRQMLIERVTIIIHGAASVRFNDSLKYAIFVNTRSTRDICILAQSMTNLKALVYISTIFVHSNEPFVEDKVYPPVTDWKKMIEIAESLDEHTLNIFTAKCLDYVPNTYTFSKNLAEGVITEYSSSLPCEIIRPSLVMPSVEEPMPGWIDNVYGPIGLYIGGATGAIRVAYCKKDIIENGVPVDVVINAIIISIWKLGLATFPASSTPFVLNCTSGKHVTYQTSMKLLHSIADDVPLEGTIWIPNTILTDNFILFYILTILLHLLPVILIDPILYLSRRQFMLMRLLRKLYVANCAVSYFSLHEWKYSNTNMLHLTSSMPQDNQNLFLLDYSDYDIKRYVKNSAIGGKKFLLHEDVNRLDAAKAHIKRVYLLATAVKIFIFIVVLWILYKWIFFNTL